MFDIDYPPPAEKVVLAGLLTQSVDKNLFDEDIAEMIMLCRTAGADVLKVFVQKMQRPRSSTYVGKGKLEEIKNYLVEQKCDTLVIDADLTPGQTRTIEKIINAKVVDRSQLILDIFAQHAKTNEAKIQVELAQMNTLYPRLSHAWSHFSKQVGGIGTKGPGEKQLEVDRRLVQKKIADLKKRLKKIERSRLTQRKSRDSLIKIALVGYTNVGKSSLLNALSGSKVLVENKLFATLDTATRKAFVPEIGEIVISDTVGFLRKLPHHLVASFKSTLEVVRDADILIVVMDASSSWPDQQLKTVNDVLKDLGVQNEYSMVVFNKADLVKNNSDKENLKLAYPESVLVSAFNNEDVVHLKNHIRKLIIKLNRDRAELEIINKQSKIASS